MPGRHRLFGGWVLLLALLAAACSSPRPRPKPVIVTVPSGSSCVALLQQQGVRLTTWPGRQGSCRVDTPVQAVGSVPRLRPQPPTSCSLLLEWTLFETEIDRIARATLGSGLRSVMNFGSFACRRMTGNAGRASLHASARAIDIAGFELNDGRIVLVEEHWGLRDVRGVFLEAVATAGCQRFSAVLTPKTDSLHYNHLHFDLGAWRICDA